MSFALPSRDNEAHSIGGASLRAFRGGRIQSRRVLALSDFSWFGSVAVAKIVLVGTDLALLEGLAQTLAGARHEPVIAATVPEAAALTAEPPPLLAVVERAAFDGAQTPGLQLAAGGALVVYRTVQGTAAAPLPPTVQRLVLADLVLPLERQRLIALASHVEQRATRAGRLGGTRPADPSEEPPGVLT